jgi:hypothetical protein
MEKERSGAGTVKLLTVGKVLLV